MGGKAVIQALVASAVSLAVFVVLTKSGVTSDLSLFLSLGLAGALNIGRLATLNPELVLPTSCRS